MGDTVWTLGCRYKRLAKLMCCSVHPLINCCKAKDKKQPKDSQCIDPNIRVRSSRTWLTMDTVWVKKVKCPSTHVIEYTVAKVYRETHSNLYLISLREATLRFITIISAILGATVLQQSRNLCQV